MVRRRIDIVPLNKSGSSCRSTNGIRLVQLIWFSWQDYWGSLISAPSIGIVVIVVIVCGGAFTADRVNINEQIHRCVPSSKVNGKSIDPDFTSSRKISTGEFTYMCFLSRRTTVMSIHRYVPSSGVNGKLIDLGFTSSWTISRIKFTHRCSLERNKSNKQTHSRVPSGTTTSTANQSMIHIAWNDDTDEQIHLRGTIVTSKFTNASHRLVQHQPSSSCLKSEFILWCRSRPQSTNEN